jgi:predicted phosphoadenosine phosphosulfate sulfurtransferase
LIRAVSPQDSKCGEMSLLPNTETTHNSYAAFGCRTSFTPQHRNTWHNDILLLWPERENREFILEFSGLYHYQLRAGRKPKYSEKTPDDLFIRRLIPVWKFLAATVVRTTALPAAHSLPAAETGAKVDQMVKAGTWRMLKSEVHRLCYTHSFAWPLGGC